MKEKSSGSDRQLIKQEQNLDRRGCIGLCSLSRLLFARTFSYYSSIGMGEIVGAVDHSAKLGFKAAVAVDRNPRHRGTSGFHSTRDLLNLLVVDVTSRHRNAKAGKCRFSGKKIY